MKAKLLVVCLVMLALAVGFATRSAFKTREFQGALDRIAAQGMLVRTQIGEAEKRLQRAQAAGVALKQSPAAIGVTIGTAAAPANNAGGVSPNAIRPLSARARIANDPQRLALYLRTFRDGSDADWGGMFKALHLSPEQMEKFKDVETSLEATRMDLLAAIETKGIEPDSAGYKKLWADYNESRVTKKAELLGEFADPYFEYIHTNAVRDLAQKLAVNAMYSETPITAAQIEQVTGILAAHSKRDSKNWVLKDTIDWDSAGVELKTVLSADQIAVLWNSTRAQIAQAKATELEKRLAAEFNKQFAPR